MSFGPGDRVLGRVGRPHGRDGSFYLDHAGTSGAPTVGTLVLVAGREAAVERRAGTAERPILRLAGIEDREAVALLRGETVRARGVVEARKEGDWPAEELIGCRIPDLGEVRRVIAAPSCDLLEVGEEGHLVPFVRDAIARVDAASRVIEVNRRFLGLPDDGPGSSPPGRPR